MQYFKPQLCALIQSDDANVRQQATSQWQRAAEQYRQMLGQLREMMPPSLKALSIMSLHDRRLMRTETQPMGFLSTATTLEQMCQQVHATAFHWSGQRSTTIIRYYAVLQSMEYAPLGPRSGEKPRWLCDEWSLVSREDGLFQHSILMSDGVIHRVTCLDCHLDVISLAA